MEGLEIHKTALALRQRLYRLLYRFVPTERARLLFLTILSGAVCGIVAVGFHIGIEKADGLLMARALSASGHRWIFWGILTPAMGGLAAGLGIYFLFPSAAGSGIPQVKAAYALHGGRVP